MQVLIFGKLPPPMGGVTVSIKNLMTALSAKGISNALLGRHEFVRRYDIAHIHYSNLLKRLLGVITGKLLAKRVIFTVHGKFLDMSNPYNRLSVKLADGFIVLNKHLQKQLKHYDRELSCEVLPSIFKEGFELEGAERQYFEPNPGYQYMLLYACDRNHRDGEEVYGVSFVLSQLDALPDNFKLVLLDISGKFREDIKPFEDRIIYIDEVVNFVALLKQADLYLRPTYMDGASVAVQEALLLNVPVVASDVVDRPDGTLVFPYKNGDAFVQQVKQAVAVELPKMQLQSVDSYIQFCQKLLNR